MPSESLALTDDQLKLLTNAAQILPQSKRRQLLRSIEGRLKNVPVSGLTLLRAIQGGLGGRA
jgi:hypothetical protein